MHTNVDLAWSPPPFLPRFPLPPSSALPTDARLRHARQPCAQWVEDARARAEFQRTFQAQARHRQSTAAEEEQEWLDRQEALRQIDVCEPDDVDDRDDDDDDDGDPSRGMVRTNSRFSAHL